VDRGRSVAVKGIPVRGMPVPFAGCRRNAGLGRSTSSAGASSLVGARTGDNGCPEDAEEGNVVACDLSRRTHRPQGQLQKRHLRPGRRVLHSVL